MLVRPSSSSEKLVSSPLAAVVGCPLGSESISAPNRMVSEMLCRAALRPVVTKEVALSGRSPQSQARPKLSKREVSAPEMPSTEIAMRDRLLNTAAKLAAEGAGESGGALGFSLASKPVCQALATIGTLTRLQAPGLPNWLLK